MCRSKGAFMMMLDLAKVQNVLLVDFYYSERRGRRLGQHSQASM